MLVGLVSAGTTALAACGGGSSATSADRTIPTAAAPASTVPGGGGQGNGSGGSGGSGAGRSPAASTLAGPKTYADQSEATGTKYARCMRSHGIDIPDPATPEFTVNYPQTAQGKAAFHACSPFLPEHFHAQLPTARELEQDFAFAKCMRDSGLTDYPDPDGKYGDEIIDSRSQWLHDPRLEDINKQCHKSYPLAGKLSGPRDFGPMG
jgi:hypothetical protein